MKKLSCDLCEHEAEGETFEEWMQALMPHYMNAHSDVMGDMGKMDEEEMKAKKMKWMSENKDRFENV